MAGDEGLVFYLLNTPTPQQEWSRAVIQAAPVQGLEEEQGRMGPSWSRGVQGRLRQGGYPWHYSTSLPTNSDFAYCKDVCM